MRRLLPVAIVAALMAVTASAALASPNVSGLVLADYEYAIGTDNAELTESYILGRVNVSGDVGENLSYYLRLDAGTDQSAAPQFSLPLVYATLKNVGAEGLNVGIGRQAVNWSIVNKYHKFYRRTSNVPGFTVNYKLDPVTLDGFYTLDATGNDMGARARYSTDVGGAALSLSGQVYTREGSGARFGAAASVGVDGFGSAYAQAGQGTLNDEEEQFVVVGATIDVLKAATGVSGWVEYDVKGQNLGFSFGREILPGLSLYLNGDKPKDEDLGLSILAELLVSF